MVWKPSLMERMSSDIGSGVIPLNGPQQYHGTLPGANGAPIPFRAEVRPIVCDFTIVQAAESRF